LSRFLVRGLYRNQYGSIMNHLLLSFFMKEIYEHHESENSESSQSLRRRGYIANLLDVILGFYF
jgi:hypothetical protein